MGEAEVPVLVTIELLPVVELVLVGLIVVTSVDADETGPLPEQALTKWYNTNLKKFWKSGMKLLTCTPFAVRGISWRRRCVEHRLHN